MSAIPLYCRNGIAMLLLLATPNVFATPTLGDAPAAESSATDLEYVVVTATRSNEGTPADLLGSSVTVLQAEDLQRRQTRVISDVLRDVPGVSVSRVGTVGAITQVRLRGTEGNHTLVLIDGIKVSNPFSGEFDFATLIADEAARVEVLRGPQSALYGSDAIGGVIHYITSSGSEAPGLSTRVEGGSFGTKDVAARYGGVAGLFDYAISTGYQDTDGTPNSRFGDRDVGAENRVVSGRFGLTPSDVLRFKAITRYSRTEAEFNDQDFNFPDSPTLGLVIDSDDHYENRAYYGLLRGELDTFDGRWTQALSAQAVDVERDNFSDGAFDSGSDGQRQRYSYESTIRFDGASFGQSVTAAFDYERESFQNRGQFLSAEQTRERDILNRGYLVQYDGRIGNRIGFGAAARHDDNDRFDSDTTFRLQGSYRLDTGLKLRAAAGSGIKNPGIFELFGFNPERFSGNRDLQPEKSVGWEIGADQTLAAIRLNFGVTYFQGELEDEIFTTFSSTGISRPDNRNTKSRQKGVEVAVAARPTKAWTIDASYTYVDSEEDGQEEVRRPPHIASLNLGWRTPQGRGGVDLTVRYNGSTDDSNFATGSRVRLDAFTLVNLGVDWNLTDTTQIYGRIENLLDEDYEEVFSYRTPGLAGYAGARVKF